MKSEAEGNPEPPQSVQSTGLAVNGWNGEYIDALYDQWREEPESVEPQWRHFFAGFEIGYRPAVASAEVSLPIRGSRALHAGHPPTKQSCVDALIYHYRDIGHLAAELDPLGTRRPFP